jgi:hypothetical protein
MRNPAGWEKNMRRVSAASVSPLAMLLILLAAPLCTWAAPGVGSNDRCITGTYSDEQLAKTKVLTLPRTFLYDRSGALIPQERWPTELKDFQKHAGDAFCCVSEDPLPPGSSGPPADCKIIVYGADVRENFNGLLSPSGQTIAYELLPPHKYLLVEYYASWCQPCVVGRKSLETFFSSASQAKDYLWESIDMSRLPEARKAAQQAKSPAP